MKIVLFFLSLAFYILPAVADEEKIKHVTVNDYLQQAATRAKTEGRKANHLIEESSPYLLQHAYNPVDWYAWGDEAFDRARKENKPIFLSIGYSTCHWCHVMAHESFENRQIAELLNRYFVCIKVDREQRPDIDSVYMSATQLINGHAGWPMSIFLDNRLRPFHAATYLPPFSRDGRQGLQDILLKIHELWQTQPQLIEQVATTVTTRIRYQADETAEQGELNGNINKQALRAIAGSYDEEFGGFSFAPKFPRPGIFYFLNQLALGKDKNIDKEDRAAAQTMIQKTLDAMASGGIYDQLAGGFHRYSVDERWQVPHFEKMLYNQGLMVLAYSDFYKIEAKPRYKQIVYEVLAFVSREMQLSGGGFFSALDADSVPADNRPGQHAGKKAEGAYYLWHESELKRLLPAVEFSFIKKYFHVSENGNIASDPQDEFTDLNIFYIDEAFRGMELTAQEITWLASAKKQLNKVRRERPRPHLDDKIITAWNGIMLSAFARAAQVFDDAELLEQAEQAAAFIKTNLYNKKTGRLYRQYRKQNNTAAAATEATLSDYAWLIHGLLEIYQAGAEKQWLNWAHELQVKQDELFLDESSAAYYDSVSNDTSLLFRSKSIYDDALPSANAVTLSNLRQFASLTDQTEKKKSFTRRADSLVSSFATAVNENPSAAAMLLAVELEQANRVHIEAGQEPSVLQ
jgi:uncharacterized protein